MRPRRKPLPLTKGEGAIRIAVLRALREEGAGMNWSSIRRTLRKPKKALSGALNKMRSRGEVIKGRGKQGFWTLTPLGREEGWELKGNQSGKNLRYHRHEISFKVKLGNEGSVEKLVKGIRKDASKYSESPNLKQFVVPVALREDFEARMNLQVSEGKCVVSGQLHLTADCDSFQEFQEKRRTAITQTMEHLSKRSGISEKFLRKEMRFKPGCYDIATKSNAFAPYLKGNAGFRRYHKGIPYWADNSGGSPEFEARGFSSLNAKEDKASELALHAKALSILMPSAGRRLALSEFVKKAYEDAERFPWRSRMKFGAS